MKGVTKSFGAKVVLRGVDLGVREGSIHVVVGPNGAGKTTVLRIAAGVLVPDSGVVRVLGESPRSKRVKRLVGYLGERLGLSMARTVRRELEFSCLAKGFDSRSCREEVARVARVFGLIDVVDEDVGSLSYGTRRRVAIARAFIGWPRLVILDEPLRGLDSEWRSRFLEFARRYVSEGRAILMTCHEIEELPKDFEATLLVDGEVVARGLLSEVVKLWGSPSRG